MPSCSLKLVFHLTTDLPALQWPSEDHATRAGRRAEDAGVALGEPKLVRHVRSLNTDLPVVADVRTDTEVERVVRAEPLQTRLVLRVVPDMRVRHVDVHVA